MTHHSEYGNASIRMGSPTSTIGSVHPDDQTSFSDSEHTITDQALEKKWEQKIGLKDARKEEQALEKGPKIERPEAGSEEEKVLVAEIVRGLRRRIKELTEDELFERAMLRGSQVGFDHQPQTGDIDAIMRSMMPSTTTNGINGAQFTFGGLESGRKKVHKP